MKLNFCIDCNKQISRGSKRCKSCAQKGELNHFKGKSHSDKSKEKMSLIQKEKQKWKNEDNPRHKLPLFGKDNPNWKGGLNKGKSYSAKFKKMRSIILNTYQCCQWCKIKNDLVVHHIDHDIKNNEFVNLIVLCRKCNIRECHDLKIIKFYYFRAITENTYQRLYLYDTEKEIINMYPGCNYDLENVFRNIENNPKANIGREWGIIKTKQ